MDFLMVAAMAMFASGLTMFSGFGLGMLLLPVFALFFPVDLAVAATAVVHGANNILKAALLGRLVDRGVALRFGLPAIAAAFGGAWMLGLIDHLQPLATYTFWGKVATVTPVKLVIAFLMAAFAALDLHPRFERLEFDRRLLPVGGLVSGFFGGLSGHQGALRSAFLAKVGITPKGFVGTNAVIALAVDLARIPVYGAVVLGDRLEGLAGSREGWLIAAGIGAAFAGVLIGRRVLHKMTMKIVQRITGAMLILIALLLGAGWI